ncbi:hypothetical protein ATO13_12896 [Stappia sp. 22II-S9-Z10]|nr:hypothetical protein ATO13_12896 [Stappia sp. 22II-S9-Z10]
MIHAAPSAADDAHPTGAVTRAAPDRRSVLAALLASAALHGTAFAAGADEADPFDPVAAAGAALDQLHSITIVHRGETRFARRFAGPPLDRAANVKSVSKSIVALLTGIAVDRGIIPGTEATLGELAPGLVPDAADPRVKDITVADLLTMQAGLEGTSGPNYGPWVQSADWVRFALTRPMVAAPGEAFQYSTGTYHVLGAVLAETGGASLLALARDWLGDPLGITIPAWTRDPQGRYLGGNNMALTPAAMARIGEMVRLNGEVDGSRVVSEEWISRALTPVTRSPFSGDAYGLGWFLRDFGGAAAAYARGFGGQMIYVVPALELTVAVTSDPTRPARTGGHVGDLNRLLEDDIIPALDA